MDDGFGQAFRSRAQRSRLAYDDYKISFHAGVSDVRHALASGPLAEAQRGEGRAALVKGPHGHCSWQRRAHVIAVEYPPGASDPIHRHNAHAFVYDLEGSIVMQVRGG